MSANPAVDDRQDTSPLTTFLDGCREGRLRYQVDPEGRPVFFPRLFAPGSGAPLEWRDASGLGTVHAATTTYPRGDAPYNVVLVDLDEGFRMMSTVVDFDGDEIPIGLRVQVRMQDIDGEARPVFVPHEER